MNYKAIILDRDGVINADSDDYIKSAEEWQPLPGAIEAIVALKRAGYIVCVCSNQSGVGRDYFDLPVLTAMHQKLHALLAEYDVRLDRLYFCPHHPDDGCQCRKPATAMLQQVQKDFGLNKNEMLFVGDTKSDYECAQKLGCAFALVLTGKGERNRGKMPATTPVYADLAAQTNALCALLP